MKICVEKSEPKSVEKNHPLFPMWRNSQLNRNLQGDNFDKKEFKKKMGQKYSYPAAFSVGVQFIVEMTPPSDVQSSTYTCEIFYNKKSSKLK